MTVLDIDLDFFTSPIVHNATSNARVPCDGASFVPVRKAVDYLNQRCLLPVETKTPGRAFEHHDQVFDYAIKHFSEPVHLIHLDAHADIGGGQTRCWNYVCTDYAHLPLNLRRFPKRGELYLNCGNFIVFLAACGLLREVTFVSHPDWAEDYNAIYMKDCDVESGALQIKKVEKDVLEGVGMMRPLCELPHEVEAEIPFRRISSDDYRADSPPNTLFVTRSPGYTPACSDSLYDALVSLIDQ